MRIGIHRRQRCVHGRVRGILAPQHGAELTQAGDATSAGAVVNAGIDCLPSTDGLRSLRTRRGVRVISPVTPSCSERVIPVPLGASLINQASAAAMPGGLRC